MGRGNNPLFTATAMSVANSPILHSSHRDERSYKGSHQDAHDELKGTIIRGGAITVTSQLARFLMTTVATVVLARLLSPQDYGLVAMVTAIIGILRIFADAGLSTATVQRESLSEELLSTIFWMNVAIGAGLTVLAIALAPALVHIYREPQLFWITLALASTFAIDAATAQHQALLRRRMRFIALAIIDILSSVVGLTLGIVLAIRGFGYWALVAMQIIMALSSALAVWFAEPWRPGAPQRRTGAKSMVRFGAYLTATNFLSYLFRNADNALIGWRWGASPLGLYQKAYGLLMLPINQINAPISNVAVSALSRVQSDPGRQRSYFVGGYSLAVSLFMPVIVSAWIFADHIILLLLGDKWIASIQIFRLLAPATLIGALLNPFGWLFISSGRADRQMKAGIVWSGLIVLSFVLGLRYGPEGVAICYSAMSALLALPICFYALAGTAVRFGDVVGAIKRPFLATLVSATLVLLIKQSLPSSLPSSILAVGGCLTVLTVYAFVLLVLLGQWSIYRDLVRHLHPTPVIPKTAA
jgi:O-antigen/teichoic acid export membrane protein